MNGISTKDATYMRFVSRTYQYNEPMSPIASNPMDIGNEIGMNRLSRKTRLDTKIHPVIP